MVLSYLLQAVQKIEEYLQDKATAVAEEHGGVQKHGFLDDLMIKISHAVDVATYSSLHEQVAALSATIYTTSFRFPIDRLWDMQKILVHAIKLAETVQKRDAVEE
jgi:phage I-like protein